MKTNRNTCVSLLSGLLTLALPVVAQTPRTAPQPTLAALMEESAVPLANIEASQAASIVPNVLAAIQAGALEIRQSVQYDPAQAKLQFTGFLVAAGAPLPTPFSEQPLNLIWSYSAQVSRVQVTVKPRNSFAFGGTITAARVSPFGDLVGAPVTISASYVMPPNGGAVTQFGMVATSIAGTANVHSASGAGQAKIDVPTPFTVLPVAIAGPKGTLRTTAAFQLDGTQSSDPTGGAITYRWIFVPVSGQTVTLTGEMSATPGVILPDSAYGDYQFVLMVINSAGLTSTDTVTIGYVAPDDPGQ